MEKLKAVSKKATSEEIYIEGLNRWSKRVAEWQRQHRSLPPIFVDMSRQEPIWLNREQRRRKRR